MKTNHFELRLTQQINAVPVEPNARDMSELSLIPTIWIDGCMLDEPHCVSVNAVLQSFAKKDHRYYSDWHFVFTCGCGSPACASIDEGVGAVEHDNAVEWVFRRPQANRFGSDVLGYKKWCETATWHTYRFDRHQVTQEMTRFLDEVWQAINSTDIDIVARSEVLGWFIDDPRYFMRYRTNDWLNSGSQQN